LILYTEKLLPKTRAGLTIGCIILIGTKHKDDKGLIEHEKTHCKQFKRNPFMPLLYLISKKHRLAYEVEAYKISIKYGWPLEYCATCLTHYNLNITYEKAMELLK